MTSTVESDRNSGQRRNGHLTHREAQLAVASELRKRGYEASFTTASAKRLGDLVAVSPVRKLRFLLDVKGLYRPNPWIIKPRQVRDDLFYVVALVPADGSGRFFVLTQERMNAYVKEELQRLHRPADYPAPGILLRQLEGHENDWGILPD